MADGKVGEAYIELRYKLDQLQRDLTQGQRQIQQQVQGVADDVSRRTSGMFDGAQEGVARLGTAIRTVQQLAVVAFATQAATAVYGFAEGVAQAATAVYGFAEGVAQAGDRANLLRARLQGITGDAKALDLARDTAQRLGVSIESAASAMARFGMAGKDIGLSTTEVQRLTETVLNLGRISGSSSEEMTAGMQQLAQALASGRLGGDELRSVLENMPELARVLADELGVGVGQLRDMGAEGKLTADVVARALLGAFDRVNERAAELPETLDQAKTRMVNAWAEVAAGISDALHVSDLLQALWNGMASNAEALAVRLGTASDATKIRTLQGELQTTEVRMAELRQAIEAPLQDPLGAALFGQQLEGMQQKAEDLRRSLIALQGVALQDLADDRRFARPDKPGGGFPAVQGLEDAGPTAGAFALLPTSEGIEAQIQAQEQLDREAKRLEEQRARERKAARDKEARDAAAAARELASQVAAVTRDVQTPQERYSARVAELDGLMKRGAISADLYARAVAKAKEELAKASKPDDTALDQLIRDQEARWRGDLDQANARRQATEEALAEEARRAREQDPAAYYRRTGDTELAPTYDPAAGAMQAMRELGDESQQLGKMMGDAVKQGADIATDALTQFAMTGKLNVKELARTIEGELVHGAIRLMINSMIGGMGGGQGGAVGGLAGLLFGTGAAATASATPGGASQHAKGGVRSGPGIQAFENTIVRAPTFFTFARGAQLGLMGEAGDEAIMPLAKTASGDLGVKVAGGSGGGSGIKVNVNNYGAPEQVQTSVRQAGGDDVLDVTLLATSKRQFNTGQQDDVMRRFGVRPKPLR